jgi:hypothetical protein
MVALLPLALLLLLAADRQRIVRDGHFDILLVEAGKFGGDLDFLIALADVDPGGRHSPLVSAEQREPKAREEIIKEPVHLAAQLGQ